MGEPGCSKTYLAELHIRTFDRHELIQGSEGLRTVNTLGASLPDEKGGFSFISGQMTRMWRAAASGKTAALLFDERNRINRGILSVLVSALVPRYDDDGVKCYVLNSGRPVPDVSGETYQEEIWAPVHKLAIIATSNEGRGYNTSNDDPAERARWAIKRVTFSADETLTILNGKLDSLGWDLDYGKKLVAAAVMGRECSFKHNTLKHPPTLRHLCDAIDNAALSGNPKLIGQELWEIGLSHFCGLDSHNQIEEAQMGVLMTMIKGNELEMEV